MVWQLKDKTALVTGANSGLGFYTSLALAQAGAEVLMLCRNPAKAEAARAEITRRHPQAKLSLKIADLSSQAELRRVVQEILDERAELQLLVNNAGVMNEARELTVDGLEQTFAVNHLAYFSLSLGLLPLLSAGAPARIVNVASRAHTRFVPLDLDDPQGERAYQGWRAYCQSKLANVMFTYALARRLDPAQVTVNCLHPGVVATGFGHNNRGIAKWLVTLARPFLTTAERGAAASIYLSRSDAVSGVSGRYFVGERARRSCPASYDEAAQEALWVYSERLCAELAEGSD